MKEHIALVCRANPESCCTPFNSAQQPPPSGFCVQLTGPKPEQWLKSVPLHFLEYATFGHFLSKIGQHVSMLRATETVLRLSQADPVSVVHQMTETTQSLAQQTTAVQRAIIRPLGSS